MLETVIVGGGLCGLTLAWQMHRRGQPAVLFEARDRLGGRVLTRSCPATGQALDLGPAWFWPDKEPGITQLVEALGLPHHAQHDEGAVLHLADVNRAPEALPQQGIHGGARRLAGGSARLVEALADALPAAMLQTGWQLHELWDRGDHVELRFSVAQMLRIVRARRVVLTLPPRLADETLDFEPPLPEPLVAAMRATPTWMATQAKAVASYGTPFWREAGQSGSAFVSHPQTVLGEIFDASDADTPHGALGGFLALPPGARASLRKAMPLLLDSAYTQVFGPLAELPAPGEDGQTERLMVQDWATEPFTCSGRDRFEADSAPPQEPNYVYPLLRQPQWQGRLLLGGTETASHGAGHMEGAVQSALRLARALAPGLPQAAPGRALDGFAAWVSSRRATAFEHYRRQLGASLSSQQSDQLTQRALLGAMEQVYSEALQQLDALAPAGGRIEAGRSEFTPLVLAPFSGFNKALLDEALAFNRGSCALSNFPAEHAPDADYLRVISADLAAAWQEFALSANELLCRRAGHPVAA